MSLEDVEMDVPRALRLLDLHADFTPLDLSRRFREVVKRAHPDRNSGDPTPFRNVTRAREVLARENDAPSHQPQLLNLVCKIAPLVALQGGTTRHNLTPTDVVSLDLPAGMRTGDLVQVGAHTLTVEIDATDQVLVRGDDVWINAELDERRLSQGGRVALETPLGRRLIWITAQASARRLVKLVGQGLPARAGRKAGDLFLRLAPLSRRTDAVTQSLLQRFAETWAA